LTEEAEKKEKIHQKKSTNERKLVKMQLLKTVMGFAPKIVVSTLNFKSIPGYDSRVGRRTAAAV
jgi:hypothetical protein